MKRKIFTFVICALAAFIAVAQGLPQGQRTDLLNKRPPVLQRNQNGAGAKAAAKEAAKSSDPSDPDAAPALNFNQADVELVFDAYSEQVNKTILRDPALPKAQITLKSHEGQKLTREEYLEAIEITLEMNGIHLEPYGENDKFIRAIPRAKARKEGIPLIMDIEKKLRDSGRVVSMMIPFKYVPIDVAQKSLEGFKSDSGILLVFERTNSILVTDTEQNINRMLEIAKMIDVATPVLESVFTRQIKHASAAEIKTALENIVQEAQKELEKNGKAPGQQQTRVTVNFQPNGIGRNRGQPQQQAQPAANDSVVISDADRGMIRGKVLIIADERSNKLIIITQQANMDFFDKVINELDIETTPDTVVKVYRLKYAESEEVADMINDLIGNAPSSKSSSKANQNQNAKQGRGSNMTRNTVTPQKQSVNQRTGDAKTGEINKENTTVLSDKRINGLVVMTNKELVPVVEQIIESMDVKLSQVLIETMIIEVTLGDDIATGMDWLQKGRRDVQNPITGAVKGYDSSGNPIYDNLHYAQRTITTDDGKGGVSESTTILSKLVPSDWAGSTKTTTDDQGVTTTIKESVSSALGTVTQVSHDGVLNYLTAGTATGLGGGQGGQVAANIATNIFGKAFNFVFSSDELGITAVLQATKTDSHSKYIASPIIMTVDNKEAVIEATEKRQFLTGWSAVSGYNGSGMPSPNYTAQDIGIKIKATPKINPNGTVMLKVEEEYSQVGGTQQMMTPVGSTYTEKPIDVPTTRKMSSDVLLENNQTVVFGGLTQRFTYDKETGIPFLKNIPYIGKWLFGTVEQTESRTELLVFMTPYVLDDAQAAQLEASRRKRTMSDATPWEDQGWSTSALADPVSKKEQLRRLKDEWKKQDEERKTRLAIEEEKIKRAKALKEMSQAERDFWLKMHKEELEKEQQEELEKKMLDKDSQEELAKLAAQIRKQKSQEAKAQIEKSEAEEKQQNEREKLDAEKKAEAEKSAAPATEAPKPAAPEKK